MSALWLIFEDISLVQREHAVPSKLDESLAGCILQVSEGAAAVSPRQALLQESETPVRTSFPQAEAQCSWCQSDICDFRHLHHHVPI